MLDYNSLVELVKKHGIGAGLIISGAVMMPTSLKPGCDICYLGLVLGPAMIIGGVFYSAVTKRNEKRERVRAKISAVRGSTHDSSFKKTLPDCTDIACEVRNNRAKEWLGREIAGWSEDNWLVESCNETPEYRQIDALLVNPDKASSEPVSLVLRHPAHIIESFIEDAKSQGRTEIPFSIEPFYSSMKLPHYLVSVSEMETVTDRIKGKLVGFLNDSDERTRRLFYRKKK